VYYNFNIPRQVWYLQGMAYGACRFSWMATIPPGEPEGYSHGLQFAVHFINVLGNCFSRKADYFFVLTIRFGLAWSGELKNKHSER
jgi:hypothetical protein